MYDSLLGIVHETSFCHSEVDMPMEAPISFDEGEN